MTTQLTEADLKIGHCYSAKRPQSCGFYRELNDRQILYIGRNFDGAYVMYDSPTVKNGRHYPEVSVEKFLKWAKEDVTHLMPKGEWRTEE